MQKLLTLAISKISYISKGKINNKIYTLKIVVIKINSLY